MLFMVSRIHIDSDKWWRHQMETFSALLAICAGNSPVPGEFPKQRPVTRSFDVFFDLRLNKWLSKQSLGWWFETPSRPLWRHRNEIGLLWDEVWYDMYRFAWPRHVGDRPKRRISGKTSFQIKPISYYLIKNIFFKMVPRTIHLVHCVKLVSFCWLTQSLVSFRGLLQCLCCSAHCCPSILLTPHWGNDKAAIVPAQAKQLWRR